MDRFYRKIYFDIDGVPEEKENIPEDIINNYLDFLIENQLFTNKEDFTYVKTTNYNSGKYKGLSFHIISTSHYMNMELFNKTLNAFIKSEQGQQFKDYIDFSAYSQIRSFKLPNFIGIPITNPENYHYLDPSSNNPEDYIITYLEDQRLIAGEFKVSKTKKKKVKKTSDDVE